MSEKTDLILSGESFSWQHDSGVVYDVLFLVQGAFTLDADM
jgi:hypothetical protein